MPLVDEVADRRSSIRGLGKQGDYAVCFAAAGALVLAEGGGRGDDGDGRGRGAGGGVSWVDIRWIRGRAAGDSRREMDRIVSFGDLSDTLQVRLGNNSRRSGRGPRERGRQFSARDRWPGIAFGGHWIGCGMGTPRVNRN